MLTTLFMSLALVLTFFVTLARVYPLRRILGYGMALDLGFTVTALAMFHGTLEGMLIATLFLFPFPSLHWTATPPKWRTSLHSWHQLAKSRPLASTPLPRDNTP